MPDSTELLSRLREQMVETQLRARGISDDRLLDAMRRVPRHEYAPERYRDKAYDDHPLPIDEGQTISQPFIVASMLEALQLSATDKVLEVGAGSGYVTALLAELTAQVIAMERHSPLAASASALLEKMGYANARIILGDGSAGFPEGAPYDVIVVSAAASEVPQPLLMQLAEGGRMIIPVGAADSQQLQLIHKKDGRLYTSPRELCRFVPLLSGTVVKP